MTRPQAKFCIGLTGGIGCGKSTVARLFAASGADVIDTDEIAHQLTQKDGAGIAPIRSTFGVTYIDPGGAMDRGRMRKLILSDSDAKQTLEGILHPLILERCTARLQSASNAPYAMLMAPLLFESASFLQLVRRTVLVDCSEENQISRVMQRSGLSELEIRGIMALQLPRTERLARADDIIRNDGERHALTDQVARLHRQYLRIINNHLTAS